ITRDPVDPKKRGVSGKAEYVREACDASLKRLGVDVIDLFYQHRVDPDTPTEETIGALADLVKAGKIRYIGISEYAPERIRAAAKVHPIAALQTEFSLWTRDVQSDGVLEACRDNGIGFVAYSPLGRGFLTGQIKSPSDFAPDDHRAHSPRFMGENFQKNLDLVRHVEALAAKKGCKPSQLALAWVLAQGRDIVPIPGTKRRTYLDENLGALDVTLSPEELEAINRIFPVGAAVGTRYAENQMVRVRR
ncbi:MAG TPA: aldo/keto reductase, partial [Candidatus Methylacidiphilales bacterium]|nr:aldo/keto reductase [Candidatus Methylacidiphilales bacterium]